MVKFGYTIVYVDDVRETIHFFEKAFKMTRKFVTEEGDYGELDTGNTILAFASHELGASNLKDGYVRGSDSEKPLGMEIALVTDDVESTFLAALEHGAIKLKPPEEKPWGQLVSYILGPSHILIELCSPIKS